MEQEYIGDLSDKWLKGSITPDEMHELDTWYTTFDTLQQEVSTDLNKKALERRLFRIIAQKASLQIRLSSKRGAWLRFSAAALILISLSIGIGFHFIRRNSSPEVQVSNVIRPGKNMAVLTLSDGKQVVLAAAKNGDLVRQGGIVVRKTGDGEIQYKSNKNTSGQIGRNAFNIVTTPRGGEYHLVLADGTKVWLNAGSSIKYQPIFTGNERRVWITGEVYLEVAKDKIKPFRVQSRGQEIEVLGTHFNINGYDDENVVKTTLLEGAVKVYNPVSRVTSFLKPGQQSQISHRTMQVVNTDTDQAIAWKNGMFSFHKAGIRDVLRQFSRWYDVEVIYQGAVPQVLITGKVHRDADLTTALNILKSLNIHFNIKGRTIIVNP